jgi:hypothetical protein
MAEKKRKSTQKTVRNDARRRDWAIIGVVSSVGAFLVWGGIYAVILNKLNLHPFKTFSPSSPQSWLILLPFLLPLFWPFLYFSRGWFATFYNLYPREKRESSFGDICLMCDGIDRDGRVYQAALTVNGVKKTRAHFICDRCVELAAHDKKRLIAIGIFAVAVPSTIWILNTTPGSQYQTIAIITTLFALIASWWMFTSEITEKDKVTIGSRLVTKFLLEPPPAPVVYERVKKAPESETPPPPVAAAAAIPGWTDTPLPPPAVPQSSPAPASGLAPVVVRPLSTDDRHLVELPELASIGHPFKIHVFTVPSPETAEQLQASLRVGKNNERLEGYICSRLLFLLNAAQPIQNVDGNPSRINLNNLWLLQDVWIMVIVQSEIHALERSSVWRSCQLDGNIIDVFKDGDRVLRVIDKYAKEQEKAPPFKSPIENVAPAAAQPVPPQPAAATDVPPADQMDNTAQIKKPSPEPTEDGDNTARFKKWVS